MSSVVISGDTSGAITLQAPAVAGSTTLTLPTTTGTVVVANGAQTIEFADGSASAPSITNSGDTNTGMFFPAADTIAFAEGGVEAMRLDASGNVGIGTSSPSAKLHVSGSSSGNSNIRLTNTFTNGRSWELNPYASGVSDTPFTIRDVTAGADRLTINSSGEIWIANATDQGAYNLQVGGTGVWGAGAYVNGSDARIKENIIPIDSGLDVVEKLNPVTYKYKKDWSKDQSTQTGFIAQELLVALAGKNYVDGIVQQGGEYMSVAYQNIIPILTKAIQELKAIVDEQAEKIKALEAK